MVTWQCHFGLIKLEGIWPVPQQGKATKRLGVHVISIIRHISGLQQAGSQAGWHGCFMCIFHLLLGVSASPPLKLFNFFFTLKNVRIYEGRINNTKNFQACVVLSLHTPQGLKQATLPCGNSLQGRMETRSPGFLDQPGVQSWG